MTDYTALIARRIRNNGDICNAPREGVITGISVTRWGTDVVVRWDQDEAIGWERDGTPVALVEAVSVVAAHSVETGSRKARFALI